MKEKKDCKECGTPLKEWQIKQGFDLCLECYNEMKLKKKKNRKTVHELLQDKAIEEGGAEEEKDKKKGKEAKEEKQEEYLVEKDLGEDNENQEQGEEEE